MQTVKIGQNDDILAPPKDQPPTPGHLDAQGKPTQGTAPAALQGTVSEADAIKATDASKFTTLTTLGTGTGSGFSSQPGNNAVPVGGLVDGALATDLLDALLPALLVVLLKALKLEIKKTDLQLTAKEKNTLAPLVKACLDSLFLNFNSPWVALGFSASIIYGAKITEHGVVRALDKKAERMEEQKTHEAIKQKTEEIKTPVQMNVRPSAPAPSYNKPAPIIPMTRTKMGVAVPDIEKITWEPSEEEIWAYKRSNKTKKGRTEIVKILKRRWANTQLGKK